ENFGFLNAALMAFTDDGSRIFLANSSGLHLWSTAASNKVSTIVDGNQPWINAISLAPNDTVIVCSDHWVRRYGSDGGMVASLAEKRGRLCCVSADGATAVVAGQGDLTIFDLTTNELRRSLLFEGVTALGLSTNGDRLAVGNSEGRVALIDTMTG